MAELAVGTPEVSPRDSIEGGEDGGQGNVGSRVETGQDHGALTARFARTPCDFRNAAAASRTNISNAGVITSTAR